MREFLQKFGLHIHGVLSGWDRLVLRGTLRTLSHVAGMKLYLHESNVLWKDFGRHVEGLSERIKQATQDRARRLGLKVIYLYSPRSNKEEIARQMAQERDVEEGPICILSTVEVCRSYEIRRDAQRKEIHLESRLRKCLFYYHYFFHPQFGFMNARIQTWAPFPVQICINGREWLSRMLAAAGIGYVRRDNCFTWIEDVAQAQRLMDQQLSACWPSLLDAVAAELNPVHDQLFPHFPITYYWSAHQSEWATDVMFKTSQPLTRLYPRFIRYGITAFASADVLRFLGRMAPAYTLSKPTPEVVSDVKRRPEGIRIKHALNANSVKLYDKQGSVMRVETTVNLPREMKVYRPKEGDPDGPRSWRYMRQGIADLYGRAQTCQAVNERYLDALAAVSNGETLHDVTASLTKPKLWKGMRLRPLRPWATADLELLRAVNRGEFLLHGFRNRDVRKLLYPSSTFCQTEKRRQQAAITRAIRLLRAHGLLRKISRTHRYHVTSRGRKIIAALLAAQQLTLDKLTADVA